MNKKKEMEELRDKLNKMINENGNPKVILELSQELDIHIVEAMKKYAEMFDED